MAWRNPETGLYESGNPTFDRRNPASPGYSPTTPDDGQQQPPQQRVDTGGWTYPTSTGPMITESGSMKDGYVQRVTDVLGVQSLDTKDSHTQQTDNTPGPYPETTN